MQDIGGAIYESVERVDREWRRFRSDNKSRKWL
jgi:hypothetical protein